MAVEVPPAAGDGRPAAAPEHLTLLFLGEIPRERAGPISETLAAVGERTPPFSATLSGVGAFPSPDRPRVVWVGVVGDGREELVRLAGDVRSALAHEGDPSRRDAFAPHLTLFRVRSSTDAMRARELLAGTVPPPPPRRFRVSEFVLKESELSPRGAHHRTLATFPLRGPSSEPP